MDKNKHEIQGKDKICTSRFEIQVLNYTNGETVDYPFVLLECEIKRPSLPSHSEEKLGEDEGKSSLQELQHDAQHDSVLVDSENECRSWPVIQGGFKALVELNTGDNSIKMKTFVSGTWMEKDFMLTYVPSRLSRFVRVVYIKCSDSDGSFEAPTGVVNNVDMATKKLAFNARLLQTFTAQDLYQHGFGHKTFRLEEDSTGKPLIHVFTSSLTSAEALKMTGGQLYDRFLIELSKSHLHSPLCKFWSFMSCTRYDPPPPEEFNDKDIHTYVRAHTALGGGQLALFGTGNLHTWATDIDELISCFTNTNMIDRSCLFDDSARRGSYWANYATGLGASMHELGHCFDLAHTPGGIMGRGFDDFNCVFSLWKNPPTLHCQQDSGPNPTTKPQVPTIETSRTPVIGDDLQIKKPVLAKGLVVFPNQDDSGHIPERHPTHDLSNWINDTNLSKPGNWSHGAKWYRSSAVILRYHKWFCESDEEITSNQPTVHWCRSFFGPVGYMSDNFNCNKTYFNDKKWLADTNSVLCGYVIHADTYVNSIQLIGKTVEIKDGVEQTKEIFSTPHGRVVGQKYVFKMGPDEHVTALDVRAGAWIDAIRIRTNYKSSVLMGGRGGCIGHFEPPEDKRIAGMFGCAGEFVGSLGIFLESIHNAALATETKPDEDLVICAPNGLRLIELHNKKHGEVCKHWEFLDSLPPTQFTLNKVDIIEQEERIVVLDDKGNMHSSGPFVGLDKVLSAVTVVGNSDNEIQETTKENVQFLDDMQKDANTDILRNKKEIGTKGLETDEFCVKEEENTEEDSTIPEISDKKESVTLMTSYMEEEVKEKCASDTLEPSDESNDKDEYSRIESDKNESLSNSDDEAKAKIRSSRRSSRGKDTHPQNQLTDKYKATRFY